MSERALDPIRHCWLCPRAGQGHVAARLTLRDLNAVFAVSKDMKRLEAKHGLQYDGWGTE